MSTDENIRSTLRGMRGYRAQALPPGIRLRLDANEGARPGERMMEALRRVDAEVLRRYPKAGALEGLIAEREGVAPERVMVTAGGDEAIDRVCRALLEPGREIVVPVPTFEMVRHYAKVAGAGIVEVAWPRGAYPTQAVLDAAADRTAVVAVVSPNNPTGSVATARDLERVASGDTARSGQRSVARWIVLADLAYEEFADEPLAGVAQRLDNVIQIRTFSKAWGLAGLRVGYAIGPGWAIEAMRAAGGPYSVSGLSIACAAAALEAGPDEVRRYVECVRREREELRGALASIGAEALPSGANFVLARFRDPAGVHAGLIERGILVRRFRPGSGVEDWLRITCPGDEQEFRMLMEALRRVGE